MSVAGGGLLQYLLPSVSSQESAKGASASIGAPKTREESIVAFRTKAENFNRRCQAIKETKRWQPFYIRGSLISHASIVLQPASRATKPYCVIDLWTTSTGADGFVYLDINLTEELDTSRSDVQKLSRVHGDLLHVVRVAEQTFEGFTKYDLVSRNCQHFAFEFASAIGAFDDLPPGTLELLWPAERTMGQKFGAVVGAAIVGGAVGVGLGPAGAAVGAVVGGAAAAAGMAGDRLTLYSAAAAQKDPPPAPGASAPVEDCGYRDESEPPSSLRTYELERPLGRPRRKEPGQEAWDCGENEDSPLRSHRLRHSARGPTSPASFVWACPACTLENDGLETNCAACGARRPAQPASPEAQQLRFDAAGTTAGVLSPPIRVQEARILENADYDSFKDPSFRER